MKSSRRVLLVDDVRLFLELEKIFLQQEELEIVTAQSGMEALKIIHAGPMPHLVSIDLHMPGMDGDACCRIIKEDPQLAAIPVLLVADGEVGEDLERCRRAGCDAIVTKPLNRNNLLQAVRLFLPSPQRPAPRVKARLLVHYGVTEAATLHDYSVNLSAGGLFLETTQALPVDTPVTLEYLLPGAAVSLICKARVAWINAAGSKFKTDLPAGLGLQFLDLHPHDVRALQEFVRSEILRP